MKTYRLLLAGFLALTSCIHLAAEVATNNYERSAKPTAELQTASIAEQNAAWCEKRDCSTPPLAPVNVLMDTHAHLAMGPGMGRFFTGVPWDQVQEPHWSYRFSEKMAVEKLLDSGYGLVVVSLYANVFAVWPKSVPTAIDEALAQMHELVRRHPDRFVIVTTSEQARRAIGEGKMALMLHLEGAEWATRSETELARLYRAGIRSINPIHIYDSWLGGADIQAGGRVIMNPPGAGNSHHVHGRRENRAGLTPQGRQFMRSMRDYGMIIDISHFSRQALRDLHAMEDLVEVPIFNSHMPDVVHSTTSERGVDQEAFDIMRVRGGVLGLVPTAHSPEVLTPFEGLCPGSVETYAAIYGIALTMAGGMPVAIASDFNGGIGHLKPTHGADGCYAEDAETTDFQRHGLAHAGYIPHVVEYIREKGHDVTPLYAASERFLELWERAEQLKNR
jgi:microsomal dipeptidase-like Zn-dependent dipeptidase